MPVNVIMPPASAPKIVWAADVVIGRVRWSPRCSSSTGSTIASAIATTLAARTGSHIAPLSRMRNRNRRPVASRWCAWYARSAAAGLMA